MIAAVAGAYPLLIRYSKVFKVLGGTGTAFNNNCMPGAD